MNTRIDSLPLHHDSAAWVAAAGTVPLNYLPSFPVNYVNASTPIQKMVFFYTPQNNGPFQIPEYPGARLEAGWFVAPFLDIDRHFFSIDTSTGTFQEMYNFYPEGAAKSIENCQLCTSQSGIRYSNSTYALPSHGSTDAAGLYVMPLTLRLQELEQALAGNGAINHALRFTLQNGYIKPNSFEWPATSSTSAGGGLIPFGARFRLRPSFAISSFSPIAQILLRELKQYGIILADGGYGWQVTTEFTRWPDVYRSAFAEIASARISPANFEAVDESSLQVAPNSGATTWSETVVATDERDAARTARQQVVLTGATLNLAKDVVYVQAGALAQQLQSYSSGTRSASVSWSMSPPVGTLSESGLYTPPSSLASAVSTTVKATNADDGATSATMTLTVLPVGTIRLVLGQSHPYTDSEGHLWLPRVGDDGCRPYDNGGVWPAVKDVQLYKVACFSDNDIRFDFAVRNGTYQIKAKFAETENVAQNFRRMHLESQGVVVISNVDVYSAAGGRNRPVDFTLSATVTQGILSFVVRRVRGDFSLISALQIDRVSASHPGEPVLP